MVITGRLKSTGNRQSGKKDDLVEHFGGSSTYLKALRPIKYLSIPIPFSTKDSCPRDTVISRHSPSNPVSPDSYLRRLLRHDDVPKRCRNHLSSLQERLSRSSRLPLRGRNRMLFRFPIRFSLCQDPIGSLRQMPSYRANRLLMTLPLTDPLV
jgi:hypothetical protein